MWAAVLELSYGWPLAGVAVRNGLQTPSGDRQTIDEAPFFAALVAADPVIVFPEAGLAHFEVPLDEVTGHLIRGDPNWVAHASPVPFGARGSAAYP